MTGLAVAVESRHWEAAWLYLLLGVAESAAKLPPESLGELIELLSVEEAAGARRPGHER